MEQKQVKEQRKRLGLVPWSRIAVTLGIAVMLVALIVCAWGAESQDGRTGADVVQAGGEDAAVRPGPSASSGDVPSVRQEEARVAFEEAYLGGGAAEAFVPQLPEGIFDKKLSTPYVVLYDATHSKVLYSKNADTKCYPASTTKLLTACVAAKICAPDTLFTVGEELSFVAWDSSTACLAQGEQLTFEMLMDALLLPSGNDAAYVIAAGAGRIYADDESLPAREAVDLFCEQMNKTAKRIGALDTHFVNPDGYHDDDHYTTAMDMMKIALYASSFEVVRNAYGKLDAEYELPTGQVHYWENSNPLIDPGSAYFYEYASGMKTGFTDQAGSCLIASACKSEVELIAVALNGVSIDARNRDLHFLFDTGFEYCIPEDS